MTYKEYKTTLKKAKRLFDKYNLPHALYASTLKGIMTTGKPFETDNELDFCVLATDLQKVWSEVEKDPSIMTDKGVADLRAFYFLPQTPDEKIISIAVIYTDHTKMYVNVNMDNFLVYPVKDYLPWKKYFIEDEEWNIPGNYQQQFERTYGKYWTENRPDFHWTNSGAFINASSIVELDKKWEEMGGGE